MVSKISIDKRIIDSAALIYICAPLVLFCAFWCAIPWCLIFFASSAIAVVFALRNTIRQAGNAPIFFGSVAPVSSDSDSLELPIPSLILLIAVCAFIPTLAGIGGIAAPFMDMAAGRIATYSDLLAFDWPVIYDDGKLLVYYIGFWLPPAGLCKLLALVSPAVAASVAQFILWLWTFAGMLILGLLMSSFLKGRALLSSALLAVGYFLASSPDAIAYGVLNTLLGMGGTGQNAFVLGATNHPFYTDMMLSEVGYRAVIGGVFCVFNQLIPSVIATLLILRQRNLSNFVLIGAASFASAPFCTVGVFLVAIGAFISLMVSAQSKKEMLRSLASVQNIAAILPIVLFASYYTCTYAVGTVEDKPNLQGGTHSGLGGTLYDRYLVSGGDIVVPLVMYLGMMVFEFLPAVIFALRNEKRNAIVICCAIGLALAPFYSMGMRNDFLWNFTIPLYAVMTLYNMLLISMLIEGKAEGLRKSAIAAACVFLIGLITTGFWLAYAFYMQVNPEQVIVATWNENEHGYSEDLSGLYGEVFALGAGSRSDSIQ